MTMITGASTGPDSCWACRCSTVAAASVAVTADVAESGAASANGKELRHDTRKPLMAAHRNESEMP